MLVKYIKQCDVRTMCGGITNDDIERLIKDNKEIAFYCGENRAVRYYVDGVKKLLADCNITIPNDFDKYINTQTVNKKECVSIAWFPIKLNSERIAINYYTIVDNVFEKLCIENDIANNMMLERVDALCKDFLSKNPSYKHCLCKRII